MSGKLRIVCAAFVMMLGALAAPSFAQNNGGGGGGGNGGGGGGGGGGRGGWNPQQMWDQLKTDLGATDDEFTAIQPKIQKVMQSQRDAMGGGMFGGRGGRGGRGGGNGGGGQGGGNANPSAVQTASEALKTTLDNKDSTPDEIKTKLAALRDAKKAAKEDLSKAQDDLKSVLTARQEAVLVQRGMLD